MLECDARFAAFPAHDGEMGVLPNRAPLVCKLGIGPLRVDGTDGKQFFFIDGGFAQMLNNRLTILTEQARKVEELDAASAQRSLTDAMAMKVSDDAAFASRNRAVQSARVQKRMLETARH